MIRKVLMLNGGRLEIDQHQMASDMAQGTLGMYPVPFFLINHSQGNVLFDTGIHCRTEDDPTLVAAEKTGMLFNRSRPGEDAVSQLAMLGLRPEDIRYVVLSHFHFDHRGGAEFFPASKFIVQSAEMDTVRNPGDGVHNVYPKFAEHQLQYQVIDGEHDIFGDGSLVVFPTPGHTAGHQSLLIRSQGVVQAVLTGDACYDRRSMESEVLPPHPWSMDEMTNSIRRLRDIRDKQGAVVFFGHDIAQFRGAAPDRSLI